jgi:hypothetical protein
MGALEPGAAAGKEGEGCNVTGERSSLEQLLSASGSAAPMRW